MIYNFNLGIGWASSGVEYAQSYRASMLRNIGKEAKFIYTDMFLRDNIIEMTRNIGFLDSEIIWLYSFFTDYEPEPVTYTLDDLKAKLGTDKYTYSRDGKVGKLLFDGGNDFCTIYFLNEEQELVHRVEYVSKGFLIRKDYFTSGRVFCEYYAPLDNKAHVYQRRFFNRDGSVAYDEIIDDDVVMYKFPEAVLSSKEELVGLMVRRLKLTADDIIIIDRTTGIGQAILQNAAPAKIGIVIHADHFAVGGTDDNNILWNNFYEYAFSQKKYVDFYITATDDQNKLLAKQFLEYEGTAPRIETIPVGSLTQLTKPQKPRKPYSLITASRLATEKHIDWLVQAVVDAKKYVPELSLDIYGKGGEEAKLRELIQKNNAQDYIRLMGQQDLSEVYVNYEAYLSGSTSEGFGLTLMEAIGSGLPIIGFDVRYGNQNFIDDEKNGFKLEYYEGMENVKKVKALADSVIQLFTEADMEAFHTHSYEKATQYLTKEVEKRWKTVLEKTV